MDDSPVTSPTSRPECPLVVVTGPTSLVKSSSSRLSDSQRPARLSDHHDHVTVDHDDHEDEHSDHAQLGSDDQADAGALSDGELERRATSDRRVQRPGRHTTRSKYGTMPRKRTESKRPSRRISCKDLGSGQCQGWLMKKKEAMKSKSWVKRWFVLSRRSLYYYKTEEDVKAQGVVYLPGFQISPAPEIKTKKFAFKAHHSGTTFYFAAERQDDMAKWMNKLGLASLDGLELSEAATTAGFWKPAEMLPLPKMRSASYQDVRQSETESKSPASYFSESDDDNSHHASPATSSSSSRDDITALYRNIERADLDLAGSNVRDRRSTMLLSVLSDDEHGRDDVWRHLLSLNRTLKDREQVLASIDALLLQQPITSQHLASFVVEHPDVVGQEGSKDHVPPVYSDSNSVSCDTVSVPADTVDTSSNTADTDSSISATPTRRDVLHNGVMSLSPPTDETAQRKPRRPSQETSV